VNPQTGADATNIAAIAGAALVLLLFVLLIVVWKKGRPFAAGDIFRASRLSAGNRLLPTQVLISPTSVVHYTPEWFGRLEHSMHMAHVASVRIDTNLMFSDVFIETTGGASPIRCHGHRKADAIRMKELIERYQTEYYRGRGTTVDRGPT
jgi:LPXTG-motif cell wall-anchored protein